MALRYCRTCVYPDTKPGIRFDEEGICSGCRAQAAKRERIDWRARRRALEAVAAAYRGKAAYDCLIPVSGGKDSHAQVRYAKLELGLRPLCVSVAPQMATPEGEANLRNLRERYAVDLLVLQPNPDVSRRIARAGFLKNAWPNWGHDKLIYSWPARVAADFGIPLVIMGENHDFESGGKDLGLGADAFYQMLHSLDGELDMAAWRGFGFAPAELGAYLAPPPEKVRAAALKIIWMGYYIEWDSHRIYELAAADGFRLLAAPRDGTIDAYHGIDDWVVPVNAWLKFVKFGFGRVTDVAFNHIAYGRLSREEAVALVNEREGVLDRATKDAFCEFTDLSEQAFDEVVARFANPAIVAFRDGRWRLKEPAH